jgi:hypothetical protein
MSAIAGNPEYIAVAQPQYRDWFTGHAKRASSVARAKVSGRRACASSLSLDTVTADKHGKIKKETVALKGVSVRRVTFDAGAQWSNDLKDYAGTDSCQLPHVARVLSGTLRVVMDDGSQQDFSKNDVMLLPPGHDAWSVGNEPCVFVEFSRGNDYYTGDHNR